MKQEEEVKQLSKITYHNLSDLIILIMNPISLHLLSSHLLFEINGYIMDVLLNDWSLENETADLNQYLLPNMIIECYNCQKKHLFIYSDHWQSYCSYCKALSNNQRVRYQLICIMNVKNNKSNLPIQIFMEINHDILQEIFKTSSSWITSLQNDTYTFINQHLISQQLHFIARINQSSNLSTNLVALKQANQNIVNKQHDILYFEALSLHHQN